MVGVGGAWYAKDLGHSIGATLWRRLDRPIFSADWVKVRLPDGQGPAGSISQVDFDASAFDFTLDSN